MTALYTRFISAVIFPLQEFFKKHDSVRRRRQLEQSQWLAAEKLQQLQLRDASQKLHRIQLVFLASCEEQDLVHTWDDWLQGITFYRDHRAHCAATIALNHPGMATQGEAALLLWNV